MAENQTDCCYLSQTNMPTTVNIASLASSEMFP